MRNLRRTDSSADLAHILDDGTTPDLNAPEPSEPLTAGQRIKRLLLGPPADSKTGESPTARLKILLISAFLVLHALNLCTTLTAKTAITRHTAVSNTPSTASTFNNVFDELVKISPSASAIKPVLEKLSGLHASSAKLAVQISAPIIFRLVLPSQPTSEAAKRALGMVDGQQGRSSAAILESFMSGWTKLVGDPVLSKWIVIVLIVSVFLNGYLLKGIAVGDQGIGEGFAPTSAGEAATRLLLLGGKSDSMKSKVKRRWSGGIEGLEKLQNEFTLAEAAEMAKQRRAELIEDEKERDAAESRAQKEQRKQKTNTKNAANKVPSGDSSDDSTPGSPLFMTSRKRASSHVTGRLVGVNDQLSANNGMPLVMTPNESESESIRRLPSESSVSETASSTPATTVMSDSESNMVTPTVSSLIPHDSKILRPLDELVQIFDAGTGAQLVSDEEIILMVQKGKIAAYALEKLLKDYLRAVKIRRALICKFTAIFCSVL